MFNETRSFFIRFLKKKADLYFRNLTFRREILVRSRRHKTVIEGKSSTQR